MQDVAIPPLPTVVAQVIRFDANDPKNGAAELEQLIIPDKAIGADLLRVSNSAFYGRSGKVKALKDALAVLGIKATKNLVVYLSTRTMAPSYKSEAFRRYLTRFPIFAALTAQNIALATSLKSRADEAFLAALLHSIGMNIMALQKGGHYSDMIDACEKNKWDLLKLEKQSYGMTHTELGKRAAETWKLPPVFLRLMEISPASEPAQLTEAVEQLTYTAAIVSAVLVAIPVGDSAKKSAQDFYATLGGNGDLFARHASPDALQRLQNHPFAQLAMT
ncbi:MAG: HDOD domain-containing protein [Spirochaetota bacterium]